MCICACVRVRVSAAVPTLCPVAGAWLEGWLLELRAAVHDEMRGMHVELIRELEAQALPPGRASSFSARVCLCL